MVYEYITFVLLSMHSLLDATRGNPPATSPQLGLRHSPFFFNPFEFEVTQGVERCTLLFAIFRSTLAGRWIVLGWEGGSKI